MSTAKELGALAALRDCSSEDLSSFARAAPTVRFAPGNLIITQGDTATGALLLVSGRCRTEVQNGDRRLVLGRIAPGELVGEVGLYTSGLRRSASVIAEEEVIMLRLDTAILDDPRVRGVMQVLEQRALANLAERVRRNTASVRRWDEPTRADTSGSTSFVSGMMRALRRMMGA